MRHARQGLKRDSLGFDVRHCWQIGLRQHIVKNRASRSLAVGGSEPQHARQSSIFDGEGDKLAIDIVGLLRTELSLLAMNIQLALSHQRLTHRYRTLDTTFCSPSLLSMLTRVINVSCRSCRVLLERNSYVFIGESLIQSDTISWHKIASNC